MSRAFLSKLGWLLGSVLSLPACSGGDDDDSDSTGGVGTVAAPWTDFCTGTFTQDTPVLDPFDDPLFTARAGEEYLLAAFDDTFGSPRAEFVYLTDDGPDEFEVSDTTGSWPFMSTCAMNAGVSYSAVFTDVAVFAEAELSTPICNLAKGTALPSTGGGFEIAGDFSLSGPQTYRVQLGAFSTQCGGNEAGFISVPQTRSFGVTTWLVPITTIIGPD